MAADVRTKRTLAFMRIAHFPLLQSLMKRGHLLHSFVLQSLPKVHTGSVRVR